MKTVEFSADLEKALEKGSTMEIDRWLRGFKDLQTEMAGRLLFLARYLDSIPDELNVKYVDALLSALEAIPGETRIRTSTIIMERLLALVESLESPEERTRLRETIEKHTATA